MSSVVLFSLYLLFVSQTGGSTDVKTVFVPTGNDVLLEIRDQSAVEEYVILRWSVKKKDSPAETLVGWTNNDIKPEVPEKYKETVSPSANFSVLLKNLQKTDSGEYYVQLIMNTQDRILETYKITVEDPVSPVKGTGTSVSSSSDSCNVTVSCTTDNFTISTTLTCTHQTCTHQEDKSHTTPSHTSLHMHLSDHSVTCNHSNHVYWTTDTVDVKALCFNNPAYNRAVNPWIIIISVIASVLLIIAGVSYWFFKKRKTDNTANVENTVYAIPEWTSPDQHQTNQHQTSYQVQNDTSVDSALSTYSLVGPHTGPTGPTGPTGATGPTETVYAQVNKQSQPKLDPRV